MEYLQAFYLLFPILFAGQIYVYRTELLYLFQHHILGATSKDLVIAVISARDHFKLRQAIRDTWWQNISSNEELSRKIDLQFVVGEKACEIHPDDRDNQYGCNSWEYVPPEVTSDISAVREITTDAANQSQVYYMNYPVQKISFRIREPVILTKLGLHQVY